MRDKRSQLGEQEQERRELTVQEKREDEGKDKYKEQNIYSVDEHMNRYRVNELMRQSSKRMRELKRDPREKTEVKVMEEKDYTVYLRQRQKE